jgi:hypothetical protein
MKSLTYRFCGLLFIICLIVSSGCTPPAAVQLRNTSSEPIHILREKEEFSETNRLDKNESRTVYITENMTQPDGRFSFTFRAGRDGVVIHDSTITCSLFFEEGGRAPEPFCCTTVTWTGSSPLVCDNR